MNEPYWQGSLGLARDYCLLDGVSGDAQPHAHYAHQLMLAPSGTLSLLVAGQPLQGRCLLVESMQEHAFVEPGQPMLALYAEPMSFPVGELRAWLDDVPACPQALVERLRDWSRPRLDSRVEQALQAVDGLLLDKVNAVTLAAQVSLSLSQLERLFGEQVGLSVRRLVLWRRLRLALAIALAGNSLTDAAHAAGFADSAHFSRTVRSMFGIRAQSLRYLRMHLLD